MLYDFRDVAYPFDDPDKPITDLPQIPIDYIILSELADDLRGLGVGSPTGSVEAHNGILIVRATAVQHAATRVICASARARVRLAESANAFLRALAPPVGPARIAIREGER